MSLANVTEVKPRPATPSLGRTSTSLHRARRASAGPHRASPSLGRTSTSLHRARRASAGPHRASKRKGSAPINSWSLRNLRNHLLTWQPNPMTPSLRNPMCNHPLTRQPNPMTPRVIGFSWRNHPPRSHEHPHQPPTTSRKPIHLHPGRTRSDATRGKAGW